VRKRTKPNSNILDRILVLLNLGFRIKETKWWLNYSWIIKNERNWFRRLIWMKHYNFCVNNVRAMIYIHIVCISSFKRNGLLPRQKNSSKKCLKLDGELFQFSKPLDKINKKQVCLR
jgi:hypothetical protein